MPSPRIAPKWRPSLTVVVTAVLIAVACLPALIVILLRAADGSLPQLRPVEGAALAVSIAFTLVIGLVLSRAVTGPLRELLQRAEDIAQGGRAAIRPLERYGTRDLAVLTQSFLDLASRLVERSDYVETLAAHVSHEFKSPLTGIKGAAELLRDAEANGPPLPPDSRSRFLSNILEDAERLDRLVARLRDLAGANAPHIAGRTTMHDLLRDLRARHPSLSIHASGDLDLALRCSTDTGLIVLGHLVENAVQHGAARIEIAARRHESMAELRVSDQGAGISDANALRIFDPFFTTRRETGGTGMGLHIVRATLHAHGGDISLLSPGQPTCFLVTLPLA